MAYTNDITASFNPANQSAFGDLITVNPTPVVQLGYEYLDTTLLTTNQNFKITTANGGTADRLNGKLRLQSGTNANGSVIFKSVKTIKYRQGQGTIARFTKAWTNNTSTSIQKAGVGNNTDGYFFGYNGTSFGILHRNSASGSLVDTWIPQASWNLDTCSGQTGSGFVNVDGTVATLDKTKLNVFEIIYPHLGAGTIQFLIMSPSGKMIRVHAIGRPNLSDNVELLNPNLYYWDEITKTGGDATNVVNYTGSTAVNRSGKTIYLGSKFEFHNNKAVTAGTPLNIFTLKNATTFNSIENTVPIRLEFLNVSFGNLANNAFGYMYLVKNGTFTGSPSFTPRSGSTADNGATITSGNSIASYDTAGLYTASSGTSIYCVNGTANNAIITDLIKENSEYLILPGETIALIADVTANASVSVALNWIEDI